MNVSLPLFPDLPPLRNLADRVGFGVLSGYLQGGK